MGYVMNAAELKLQFFDKSWRPVLFVKCEVIHMVTGVTVRFFDLGGYNVTTISGLTEGQSYMVRYLQYGYADDWLESIIRISSPSTKVSLIFRLMVLSRLRICWIRIVIKLEQMIVQMIF